MDLEPLSESTTEQTFLPGQSQNTTIADIFKVFEDKFNQGLLSNGQIEGGKLFGPLELNATGKIYLGQMDNGVPHGHGFLLWNLDNLMEGVFKKGYVITKLRIYDLKQTTLTEYDLIPGAKFDFFT